MDLNEGGRGRRIEIIDKEEKKVFDMIANDWITDRHDAKSDTQEISNNRMEVKTKIDTGNDSPQSNVRRRGKRNTYRLSLKRKTLKKKVARIKIKRSVRMENKIQNQ